MGPRALFLALLGALAVLSSGCGDDPAQPRPVTPPTLDGVEVLPARTKATFTADLDPRGSPSFAWVDYGVDTTLAFSSDSLYVQDSQGVVSVSRVVEGLSAGTLYRYRWRAANAGGLVGSPRDTFRTDPPNQPPETYLTAAPPETLQSTVRVHLYWYGDDPDGDPLEFQWQRSDAADPTLWYGTAVTDSVFTRPVASATAWTIRLRAVDVVGAVDGSPAEWTWEP